MSDFDADHCINVAVKGEQSRGSNGAVWYDLSEKKATYLLTTEIFPKELRESLEDMLSDDDNKHFFICVKETADKIDIAKIEKKSFINM